MLAGPGIPIALAVLLFQLPQGPFANPSDYFLTAVACAILVPPLLTAALHRAELGGEFPQAAEGVKSTFPKG